jgi:hypothetical protein
MYGRSLLFNAKYHTTMRKSFFVLLSAALVLADLLRASDAFQSANQNFGAMVMKSVYLHMSKDETLPVIDSIEEASKILKDWDLHFNPDNVGSTRIENVEKTRSVLPDAIRLLSKAADDERCRDSTMGRCMLGICASSAEEGIATLKSWVTALQLPRGLLHGMDKDGVPLELTGGVYIKYNSGGVYTFADIRKSGLGFDALWKPGDALLEPYDGIYRGVYFQVELQDGKFRQYLVPLDIFTE